MSCRHLLGGTALAFGALVATAHAQTTPSDPAIDSITLPDIRVEAARGTQLRDMDVSTTVIRRSEVLASPEQTTDQIVSKILGTYQEAVPTTGLHPTGQSITMRGFGGRGAERTLVMVDGVPINDAFFRYIDWTKIPKEQIERIEVIRGGGATSLWGNMAMGGVINIVTHEPQPGERTATLVYGMENTVNADVSATLYADDKVRVGIYADTLSTDGYNQTPAAYRNQHTGQTAAISNNLTGRVIYTPNDDTKIYAKVLGHSVDESGLVYNVTKNGWSGVDFTTGAETKLAGGTLSANGWYSNDAITTHNAGTSGYTYTKPATGNGNAIYLGAIGRTPYYDYGASVVYGRDINEMFTDVKVGADARNIVGGDTTQVLNQAGTITGLTQVHGQQWFQGVFAQGTMHTPGIPLDVTLGLREDFFRVSDGSFNGAPLASGQQYEHFDPRLGFKLHVTEDIDLRAAAYRDFGAPGMNQTFRTYYSGTSAFVANAALAPEYNTGVEAGVDWRIGGLTLSGTAFYNDLTNVIDSASICGATGLPACTAVPGTVNPKTYTKQTKYYNVGEADIKGIEALGTWAVNDQLTLNASWTLNDSYLTSNSGAAAVLGQSLAAAAEPLHNQLANVPQWTALAGATYRPMPALSLTANLKAFPSYWYDTAHTTLNDGALVLDMGVSYKVTPSVTAFVNGENITAHRYYAVGSTSSSTPPVLAQPTLFLLGVRASL